MKTQFLILSLNYHSWSLSCSVRKKRKLRSLNQSRTQQRQRVKGFHRGRREDHIQDTNHTVQDFPSINFYCPRRSEPAKEKGSEATEVKEAVAIKEAVAVKEA